MSTKLLMLWLILLGSCLPSEAQLHWRISAKIILDASGNPPNTGALSPEDYITNKVDWANEFYRQGGRGYEFKLTEVVRLSGHSELFNADPLDSTWNQKIYDGAQKDAASYKWKDNAINVYLSNKSGTTSGSEFSSVIIIGKEIEDNGLAHECGHYLGLCHTHGCGCGNECSGDCGVPVDDNIGDTIPDFACWTQDQVSNNYFHSNYSALTPTEKVLFDYTFNNLMSYHRPRLYLTPDQYDEMADKSNGSVANIASGHTWFVDLSNTCTSRTGSSACSGGTGGPYQTVTTAINKAGTGDIVLIRPGNYNEPMTINKALTLRATRGDARIGKP